VGAVLQGEGGVHCGAQGPRRVHGGGPRGAPGAAQPVRRGDRLGPRGGGGGDGLLRLEAGGPVPRGPRLRGIGSPLRRRLLTILFGREAERGNFHVAWKSMFFPGSVFPATGKFGFFF